MKITRLGLILGLAVLALAFWHPLWLLAKRATGSLPLPDGLTPIDVMVFIVLALLAIRLRHRRSEQTPVMIVPPAQADPPVRDNLRKVRPNRRTRNEAARTP